MAEVVNGNGNGAKKRQDIFLGTILILCVIAIATLGGISMFHSPQDWSQVNAIRGDLKEFILMILTGRFALSQMTPTVGH